MVHLNKLDITNYVKNVMFLRNYRFFFPLSFIGKWTCNSSPDQILERPRGVTLEGIAFQLYFNTQMQQNIRISYILRSNDITVFPLTFWEDD